MTRRSKDVRGTLIRVFLTHRLLAALCATASFNATPPRPTAYPVYFVGDSITVGRAATKPENGFRELFLAHLRRNAHLVVDQAGVWRRGWRAADALEAIV